MGGRIKGARGVKWFKREPKIEPPLTRDQKLAVARLFRRDRYEASEISAALGIKVGRVSRYLDVLEEEDTKKADAQRRRDPLGATLEGIRARAADGLARQVELDPKLAAQVGKGLQKEMLRELGMDSDPERGDVMGGLFALAKEYREPISQILMKQFPDSAKEAMLKQAVEANQRLAANNAQLMAKLRELAPELFTDQPAVAPEQAALTQDPPTDAAPEQAPPEPDTGGSDMATKPGGGYRAHARASHPNSAQRRGRHWPSGSVPFDGRGLAVVDQVYKRYRQTGATNGPEPERQRTRASGGTGRMSEPRAASLLTRNFGNPEELNGGGRCPTYMYRWILAKAGGCAVYIHRFVSDDWTRDLHDHPKRFISIGLRGAYTEETTAGRVYYRAPWLRTFPASHCHRIRLDPKTVKVGGFMTAHGLAECWTLVIVGRAKRDWGFWPEGRFVSRAEYIGSSLADQASICR